MSVHSFDSDWSGSANERGNEDLTRGSYVDHLALQWEQDPYEVDAHLTMHLLDLYFLHVGRAAYGVLPRRYFLAWTEGERGKHLDELMLLYSTLALGSLFSSDSDKCALGQRFAAVACYAAEKRFGKLTLQLCQTRLMLALYHFAQGRTQEAWDFCGAGLRVIGGLKLNTEEGIDELVSHSLNLNYGFDHRTFSECCRRTFWAGLLMDRCNGFLGEGIFVINREDVFLRLTCPDSMYETSTYCEMPVFGDDILGRLPTHNQNLGDMACLSIISTLWGDVLSFTGRAARRVGDDYAARYEAFYEQTYTKLEAWQALLPAHLRFNPLNLDNSITEGCSGTFLSVHALYHATIIQLNRHVRISALSAEHLRRNVEQCFHNASSILSMMHSLATVTRQRQLPPNVISELLSSAPFPGYGLILSIDILTSAGSYSALANLVETIHTSTGCIDDLSIFWAPARAQQRVVAGRMKQLTDLAVQEQQNQSSGSHDKYWRMTNSLEMAFGKEDAVYKAEDQPLFEIVGHLTGR